MKDIQVRFSFSVTPTHRRGEYRGQLTLSPRWANGPRLIGSGRAGDKRTALEMAVDSALKAADMPAVTAALGPVGPALRMAKHLTKGKPRAALSRAGRSILKGIQAIV